MASKLKKHGPLIGNPLIIEDGGYRLFYGFDGKKVFFMYWLSGPINQGCEDKNFVPRTKVAKWYPQAAMILKKRNNRNSPPQARF